MKAMAQHLIIAAIKRAGSEKKLGEQIGFSQHAIWHAKKEGRCSPRMAAALDEWSGGFISRHELCPAIFGPPPRLPKTRGSNMAVSA